MQLSPKFRAQSSQEFAIATRREGGSFNNMVVAQALGTSVFNVSNMRFDVLQKLVVSEKGFKRLTRTFNDFKLVLGISLLS